MNDSALLVQDLKTKIWNIATSRGLVSASLRVIALIGPDGKLTGIINISFPGGKAAGTPTQICKAIEDCASFEDLKSICDEQSLSV